MKLINNIISAQNKYDTILGQMINLISSSHFEKLVKEQKNAPQNNIS